MSRVVGNWEEGTWCPGCLEGMGPEELWEVVGGYTGKKGELRVREGWGLEALAEREREYRGDFRRFAAECLWVQPKDRERRLMKLMPTQERIMERWHPRERKANSSGGLRAIVLKARQVGCSSLSEGHLFWKAALNDNVRSLVAAHDVGTSEILHGMVKTFYDSMVPWLKPDIRYSNSKMLSFENPDSRTRAENPGRRSSLYVGNANKMNLGRGMTIHHFHGSEVAFWDDADTVMTAVKQAVPDHPDTSIILESTACGRVGYFYREYQKAKRGESAFTPVFIPWFEDPEYRMALEPGEEKGFMKSMDEEERGLRKAHPRLSLEALKWRRYCIHEKCDDDLEKFHQEYPSNDEEAFLLSGGLVFDAKAMTAMEKGIVEGERGELHYQP